MLCTQQMDYPYRCTLLLMVALMQSNYDSAKENKGCACFTERAFRELVFSNFHVFNLLKMVIQWKDTYGQRKHPHLELGK